MIPIIDSDHPKTREKADKLAKIQKRLLERKNPDLEFWRRGREFNPADLISMKKYNLEISKGRFKIQGLVQEVGEDILVSLWGGVRPHIGAVAIAVPRPSLSNPQEWSATSSNFTVTGHKEDILAKAISERLASVLKRVVVVTAGLHWDGITQKEIKVIETLAQRIPDQILGKMTKGKKRFD